MKKSGLAGVGEKVVTGSRSGRADDLREPDKITLRSCGFIVQVEQSRQPVELVIEELAFDLKLIADLLDVVVQRASDEYQRNAGGVGARAVRGDDGSAVNVDEVRQMGQAVTEDVDQLDTSEVEISAIGDAFPAVVRVVRRVGIDHVRTACLLQCQLLLHRRLY